VTKQLLVKNENEGESNCTPKFIGEKTNQRSFFMKRYNKSSGVSDRFNYRSLGYNKNDCVEPNKFPLCCFHLLFFKSKTSSCK
jgi:hypothetical protein